MRGIFFAVQQKKPFEINILLYACLQNKREFSYVDVSSEYERKRQSIDDGFKGLMDMYNELTRVKCEASSEDRCSKNKLRILKQHEATLDVQGAYLCPASL